MRTAASWVGARVLVGTRAACGPGHKVSNEGRVSPESQVTRVTRGRAAARSAPARDPLVGGHPVGGVGLLPGSIALELRLLPTRVRGGFSCLRQGHLFRCPGRSSPEDPHGMSVRRLGDGGTLSRTLADQSGASRRHLLRHHGSRRPNESHTTSVGSRNESDNPGAWTEARQTPVLGSMKQAAVLQTSDSDRKPARPGRR